MSGIDHRGAAVLAASIIGQVEQLEGVVAVRDRFTYPRALTPLAPAAARRDFGPGAPAGTPLAGRAARQS